MGIADKMDRRMNDSFSDSLDASFKKKFRRNLDTQFNIFSMCLVSRPRNGKPFTPIQKQWVDGFSEGYASAKGMLREVQK